MRVTSLFHILCDAQACSNSTDASNKPVQTFFHPSSYTLLTTDHLGTM